ncbi:uncharacterized protein LOC134235891 isoform X1 [Saccostrea cucullata]|uniref:uncharacterized protein LOC134235891 isoform X1 n=1 Tax=Saccostrea cuccullata TaxID=36930 RepID=UPI002ED3DB24
MKGFKCGSSFIIALTLFHVIDAFPPSKSQSAKTCPYNETEWMKRSTKFFCQGKEVYHCFLAEDEVSVKEKCVERTMMLKGFCPIFTDFGYLHWSSCNGTGCPNSTYTSDEVYKYRVCFGDTDNIIASISGSRDDEETSALDLGIGIGVPVVLIFVVVVIVLAYRQLRPRSDENEDIKNGIHVLHSENILYVIGKLGNSVSTVGDGIASGFAEKRNMKSKNIKYLDVSENFEFSESTVYYIDGWFGLWNDNPCEKDLVLENFRLIIESAKDKERNIKFIIGLRTDEFESYKKDLEGIGISFPERQKILRDSSSRHKDTRVETHLKELKRKCTTDGCSCKSLHLKDIKSCDMIGGHLIIDLLDLDHTMAPLMLSGNDGPLQAMKQHFKDLENEDKNLFECIFYIVLVGFYDETMFRSDVADNFSISENVLQHGTNLHKYTKTLKAEEITQMWTSTFSGDYKETNTIVVFWHTFLYISAFHACYSLYPEKMMRYCHLDAILQLVRPEGQKSAFTVEANRELISTFYEERIQGKVFEDHVKDHPLTLFLQTQT